MTALPPPGPAPVEPVPPVTHTEIPAVPGRRRRWLPFAIAGAAVLALLGGAAAAFAIVSAQRTPQAAVSAFLDELVAGDAAGAQSLLASIPSGNPVLLQPDTYAATDDRIEGYSVVSATVDGATATVTVEIEQGGERSTHELPLALVRKDLGLFDVWRVTSDALPTVYVTYARPDGMGLDVNGTEFDGLSGAFDLNVPAFPGTYVFEPTGSTDYFAAEPVTVTLSFANADDSDGSTTVALDVELTDAGVAAATAAVNATLDACLAQPVLAPQPNCGFGAIQDDATYTNIRWTLTARPGVSFGTYSAGDGWAVIPTSPGSMRLDADYETATEYGTAESVIDGFEQSGFIRSIDEAGSAVFESVEYR
ncbi:hypothetical protein [Schumannella luteola]